MGGEHQRVHVLADLGDVLLEGVLGEQLRAPCERERRAAEQDEHAEGEPGASLRPSSHDGVEHAAAFARRSRGSGPRLLRRRAAYWALVRKCDRRFFAQHASLRSVHTGRSLP